MTSRPDSDLNVHILFLSQQVVSLLQQDNSKRSRSPIIKLVMSDGTSLGGDHSVSSSAAKPHPASDGTRLTLITALPLHMKLALNTWKSQLSKAGAGNSDILHPWHRALEHGVNNQLSRDVYSKKKAHSA